jgi:hypothetical protein
MTESTADKDAITEVEGYTEKEAVNRERLEGTHGSG